MSFSQFLLALNIPQLVALTKVVQIHLPSIIVS